MLAMARRGKGLAGWALAACALLLSQSYCIRADESEYIYIKGGTVVNADREFVADVLIRGSKIEAVGSPDEMEVPAGARVLQAKGMFVMPGGIDPHTHLDMPFMGQRTCDDFESGHHAALAGGTTMHIDFALPVDGDLEAGFDLWLHKAQRGVMDFGLHVAVTHWDARVAAQMSRLVSRGVNSFKFFMAYKGSLMVSDAELLSGFHRCREVGALAQVHAENGEAVAHLQAQVFGRGVSGPEGHALSRPSLLEAEAATRAIALAALVPTPLYIVHVMARGAVEAIARARTDGQRVIGEAVLSGFALDESRLWDPDFARAAAAVMSPPIRSREEGQAVKRALAGGILGPLGTDHAVFNSTQKAAGREDFRRIPNGVNGIEERLNVAWTELVRSGAASRTQFVRATSTAAAQIFGLYPVKGHIAAGSDADVILLDPAVEYVISPRTHHSRLDTNVYEGRKLQGRVVTTVSRGRLVWHDGRLAVPANSARYVPMPAFPPPFDGLDELDVWEGFKVHGSVPVDRGLEQAAPHDSSEL